MDKLLLIIFSILKNKVSPFLQNLKCLTLIVVIYNLIFSLMIFVILCYQHHQFALLYAILSHFAFYLLWGISTVMMFAQFVEKPESIFHSSTLLKPGRYNKISIFGISFMKERTSSPVDDYYALALLLISLVIPISIFQFISSFDILWLLSIHLSLAICIGILRDCYRLEKDYQANMIKAKKIFFENNGQSDILNTLDEYRRYQVSLEYERKWKKELDDLRNNVDFNNKDTTSF